MSRILSGIRPSGELHLGHYLGAVRQWIALQETHDVFYMVADLHAITTPYEPKTYQQQVRQAIITYLALGLDPQRSTIFIQSHVPAHSELMWLLNTITPYGELQRMVQFKSWSEKYNDSVTAGILNYPILQAADILLYKPVAVPVGEDQVQHIELARDLAKKFNRTYGQTFPEPQPMLTSAKRIMSFDDPENKMSKSENNGLLLTDEPEVIAEKLKKAVTSSEPRVVREAMKAARANESGKVNTWKGDANLQKQFAGLRNLFTVLLALADESTIAHWETAADAGEIQFSEFKPALATLIADHFASFRQRYTELTNDTAYVDQVIAEGAKKASAVADLTLHEVQKKMGLR